MSETYYLIDYENVGKKGLEGAGKLTKSDWVHLFSTCQSEKITTATLANFNATNLLVHEVPAGSQSVDKHLLSFLGYLLGRSAGTPQIVIISNDTGYDDIVRFWKTEKGVVILRRGKLQPDEAKPAPVKTARVGKSVSVKRAAATAQPQAEVKPAAPEKPAGKTKKTAKAKSAEPKAEAKPDAAEKPAGKAKKTAKAKSAEPKVEAKPDTAEKPAGKAKKTTKAKSAEPKAEAKPDTAEKPAAKTKKTAKAKSVEPQNKTALNNAVLKTLSNAKYDNETVSYAASLVTKNFTEKGGKQIIYRNIISRFGQEQGLAIYRHIQELL